MQFDGKKHLLGQKYFTLQINFVMSLRWLLGSLIRNLFLNFHRVNHRGISSWASRKDSIITQMALYQTRNSPKTMNFRFRFVRIYRSDLLYVSVVYKSFNRDEFLHLRAVVDVIRIFYEIRTVRSEDFKPWSRHFVYCLQINLNPRQVWQPSLKSTTIVDKLYGCSK